MSERRRQTEERDRDRRSALDKDNRCAIAACAAQISSSDPVAEAKALLRMAINDLSPGRIALVSSFGAKSAALLHMVAQIDKATPVIFVDTDRHFAETLAYRDSLCARLELTNIVVCSPDLARLAVEDPQRLLFSADPDRCCEIRKVQPLAKALDGFDAWITGRKRFQSATRETAPLLEVETDRVKINPLVRWTAIDLFEYVRAAELTPHPLVADGFLSIGCAPCTSPVRPGEDARAGRWRGRGKIECGIHLRSLAAERVSRS
jgi:phosphoadenosine phosphosulfate reductase